MKKKVEKIEEINESEVVEKGMSLFDHLKNLTINKHIKWEDLSDKDKKTFSPYMINRFLSMNLDLCEVVNEMQHLTLSYMSPEVVYKFYQNLLPKQNMYFKYIKGEGDKYSKEIVEYVTRKFQCSNRESIDYLKIILSKKNGIEYIENLISGFGVDKKTVKKLIKGIEK